jgi:hypothetical protein
MMKKILFLLIIIYLLNASLFAQVYIGVLGGINSSSLNGDNPPDGRYTSGYGYNIGGIVDIYIFDDVTLNLQPMYSRYSTFISYDVDYQYEDYDSILIKADYTEIPINVKIVADNDIAYVTAGVSFTHLIEARAKNQRSGEERVIEDRLESFVMKANFGAGAKFSIGFPIIFFELHYSQSLTNISSDTISAISIDGKLKSNGLRLFTGIMIKLW